MKKILLLLVLFSCASINEPINDFDLSFENLDGTRAKWILLNNKAIAGMNIKEHIDGKGSICFLSDQLLNPFNACVFQTIQLPVTAQNIELSVYAKSSFIDDFWLRLLCLDGDENLLRRDSVNLASPNGWKKITLATRATGTQRIYIEAGASTKAPLNPGKKVFSEAYIDHITINLDGRSIETIVKPEYHDDKDEIRKIKDNYSLTQNSIEGLCKLKEFQDHTILGFGETVHGSREIQEFEFEAIKQLIKNNNCKLVIFEVPFDLGLRLNAYVEGDEQESIENLMFLLNMDIPELTGFLNWVKQYNKQNANRVTISGLDVKPTHQEDHLAIFLKNSQIANRMVIDQLLQNISDKNYDKAIQVVENNKAGFRNLNIQRCILRALKARMALQAPLLGFGIENREYIQFQNIQFLINTFISDGEKVAILAHACHLDKRNNLGNRYYVQNLGNYLTCEYSVNYFVTDIHVGKGTITSLYKNGYESNLSLMEAPDGSLEKMCLKADDDFFYKNMSGIKSLQSGRFIGADYMYNQFFSYSHVGRYDGLVFIKNSTGNRLPESWPKTNKEIREYLKTNTGVKTR